MKRELIANNPDDFASVRVWPNDGKVPSFSIYQNSTDGGPWSGDHVVIDRKQAQELAAALSDWLKCFID